LTEAWLKVWDVIIQKVEHDYTLKNVLPLVQEIPSLKNPFPKRKRGNRLITSLAKQMGEEGFNADYTLFKLIIGLNQDNNYKIRMDGIQFLQEYLAFPEV
jgi:hypothetical protein